MLLLPSMAQDVVQCMEELLSCPIHASMCLCGIGVRAGSAVAGSRAQARAPLQWSSLQAADSMAQTASATAWFCAAAVVHALLTTRK